MTCTINMISVFRDQTSGVFHTCALCKLADNGLVTSITQFISYFTIIVNFIVVYTAIKLGMSITAVRDLILTLFVVRSLIINIYTKVHYKYIDEKVKPYGLALNKGWDVTILQILGLAQTSMPLFGPLRSALRLWAPLYLPMLEKMGKPNGAARKMVW